MHTCKELLDTLAVGDMYPWGSFAEVSIARDFEKKDEWWLKIWEENIHSYLYNHPVFIKIAYCPFCGKKL